MRFGFGRRARGEEGSDRAAAVRAWCRAALACDEAVRVTVSELDCSQPGCPCVETVILVMAPGRPTRAVKVAAPLADVTREAVEDALAGLAAARSP